MLPWDKFDTDFKCEGIYESELQPLSFTLAGNVHIFFMLTFL